MATRSFVCILLYVVWMLLLCQAFGARRSCPPGRFCPIDTNCTNNTTSCVIVCPTESDYDQQGNRLTGNCEKLPVGTDHWMDSTYYEIFILSDQTVNTPIRDISFISSERFKTNNYTYVDLPDDITFTLNGSCPYFYFTNMLKKEIPFENYYGYYVPDTIESVSLAVAEPVSPDDYEMEVIVTNGGSVLERRDIVVHVSNVLRVPCMTSSEIKCVDFSSKFNVSQSVGSLVVTLVTSTIMPSQSFIIGVIAEADNSSEYPATAGVDFTPGRYNATFTPGTTTANTSIPVMAGNYSEAIKQFSLRLFIDGAAYEQCVFSGNVSTATVCIIPAYPPLEINHPVCSPSIDGNNFTFKYKANKPQVEYTCRLNNKPPKSCNTGNITYENLKKKREQVFTIIATTDDGETVHKNFTFVSKYNKKFCQVYKCGDGVAIVGNSTNVTFTSDDPDATFNCTLNGKMIHPCSAPLLQLNNLPSGIHKLDIMPSCNRREVKGKKQSITFKIK